MARDAVAISDVPVGSGLTNPAGTSITPANGANIAAVGPTDRLLIRVTNTNGTQRTVTFKAGANPPAPRAGLGDRAEVVPATSGDKLYVIEAARHVKADGSIDIDFETSMAGIISVVRLPKGGV